MNLVQLEFEPFLMDEKQDRTNVVIGNSVYTDDEWDLSPYMNDVTLKTGYKKLRFSGFHLVNYKNLMKQYAYYKLGSVKPRTVIGNVNGCFPSFFKYCESNSIYELSDFSESDMLEFIMYLKNEKKVTTRTGYAITSCLEELFRVGREKEWEVPKQNVFEYISAGDLWKRSRQVELNKTKPIPDKVFDRIMECAVNLAPFSLTTAGIILQSQTGLRINEILSIREGCIGRLADGTAYMEVIIRKTERGEEIMHRILVNELVVQTVERLDEYTRLLREESGKRELFLRKHEVIRNIKGSEFTNRRLKSFIRKYDIRGEDGELYPLYSHQFRASYVRNLIKKNVPLEYIKKHYAHVSIEMTAHYLTLKNEEVTAMYADMILNRESKLAGLRAGEIKEKLNRYFAGKTEEEIEASIKVLATTLSYNPLPNGVCLYDFRRGNCTDGDNCFFYNCPNYVTEARYYPVLKKELDVMELEMDRLKELGREREWQRQYVKHKYLKPLVEKLEEQINEER